MSDKYKAVWLSHSSVNDFLQCQRLYYLKHVYKNQNKRKISIANPYATLGVIVHLVLENLVHYKSEERVKQNLLQQFQTEWERLKYMAGFTEESEEKNFKERGESMMKNVMQDFQLLKNKTIQQKDFYSGDFIPNIFLSEEENIILCGPVDWIEYDEKAKGLILVDFKTGRNLEREDSRQLPIYKILVESLQNKWKVLGGKYWYLEKNEIQKKKLDSDLIEQIKKELLEIGIQIRQKRFIFIDNVGWEHLRTKEVEENFSCNSDLKLCECHKYEKIINGQAKHIGQDLYGQDLYVV